MSNIHYNVVVSSNLMRVKKKRKGKKNRKQLNYFNFKKVIKPVVSSSFSHLG